MEFYVIQYAEGVGICMVKGVSKDVQSSVFGESIRDKVDHIKAQIEVKYGSGEDVRYLKSGSIWSEPNDWMTGLLKDERVYGTEWNLGSPIDGIDSIWLNAVGSKLDAGYFIVEFIVPNDERCDEADINAGASVF